MSMKEVEQLATELGQHLVRRRWQVTTAESCTGGWISQAITAIAGSSKWFDCGFITYSNQAKIQQLGVSSKLLKENGAVCSPVVVAMANGAIKQSGADIAVAVSGIAGPDGGSKEKPVGTVWIAWAFSEGQHFSHEYHFSGNREEVRRQTVIEALKGLNMLIQKNTV
ncbi:MAG: nicotinamide-nucleotide amidase [Cellvibrionaceae bacterium]